MSETVTVVRPPGRDQYGNPLEGETTRVDITGCAVAPRVAASLDVESRNREGLVVELTLYAPFGADIRHTDLIERQGELYEVEGEVGRWENPFTGSKPGLEVGLRRAAG